jgi:hypothetical protein
MKNLKPSLCTLDPGLKMREHHRFLYCNFCYPTIQCYCNACNVLPEEGLQKRTNFSTLIVGLAGTGDQTRSTCVAGSCDNRSAIHFDFTFPFLLVPLMVVFVVTLVILHFFLLARMAAAKEQITHRTACTHSGIGGIEGQTV